MNFIEIRQSFVLESFLDKRIAVLKFPVYSYFVWADILMKRSSMSLTNMPLPTVKENCTINHMYFFNHKLYDIHLDIMYMKQELFQWKPFVVYNLGTIDFIYRYVVTIALYSIKTQNYWAVRLSQQLYVKSYNIISGTMNGLCSHQRNWSYSSAVFFDIVIKLMLLVFVYRFGNMLLPANNF